VTRLILGLTDADPSLVRHVEDRPAAATRKATAMGNESERPSEARRKNNPTARASHEARTRTQAFHASRGEMTRSLTHRATLKRISRPLAASRGRVTTRIAAAIPASATTPMAARTPTELSDVAAADDANGMRAAASMRPSMKREKQTVGTPDSQPD
jgi:hypothetical protein